MYEYKQWYNIYVQKDVFITSLRITWKIPETVQDTIFQAHILV